VIRPPAVGSFDPPVKLSAAEQAEFNRLVDRANRLGLLWRNDSHALADLARAHILLDGLYSARPRDLKAIAQQQHVVCRLRHETGITIEPSRAKFPTAPGEAMSPRAYWQDRLNGSES
jgi:hypothetical protein